MEISKKKFLVVEDSTMIQGLIENAIRELGGNRIDIAENGLEALTKLKKSYSQKFPYALMTLDLEMPAMPGIELLKLIRKDPLMKDLSVLMVSTQAQPDQLKALAPLQPNGFVVKPFENKILALLKITDPS